MEIAAHTAGYDTDHARVPIITKKHDTGLLGKLGSGTFFRKFGNAPLNALPLSIH